ncbi:ACT domain-containing protein [Rhodobacteraceae bacterium RKSG542]|uniref:ACT domain-containing protein n=1 Tax=Pseudovibrio flavus TaxID=2529854 RepID=UPI0012BD7B7C|nr:ACT domain-containing protein [Pseudovibrio flavus]MTI16406.1 ACT domain-containing protein [Pseudovibrio flavus]
MSGEQDLQKMLAGLRPKLMDGTYVFASFAIADYEQVIAKRPLATFREEEGLTALLSVEDASALGVADLSAWKGITLQIHSSLSAVGLTHAISGVLTEHGIPANVIAAYYHDHVFVPEDKAQAAIAALVTLMK